MLRSRFEAVPAAFSDRLVPSSKEEPGRNDLVVLIFVYVVFTF